MKRPKHLGITWVSGPSGGGSLMMATITEKQKGDSIVNQRLIEYSAEQIEKACEGVGFSQITFHDDWCGVEDVHLVKVTEKCIWPHNTSQARIDKTAIGSMYWSYVVVIKGDEDQAVHTYYDRVIEEKQKEIESAQAKIEKSRTAIREGRMFGRDPETKKWVRS